MSLYDLMYRYRLDMLAIMLKSCETISRDFRFGEKLGEKEADEEQLKSLKWMLEGLNMALVQMEGDRSLVAQVGALVTDLESGAHRKLGPITARLDQILFGVDEVMHARLFMFVPQAQAKHYMSLEQFGGAVAMFPNALGDMLEASNCFAVGRATACVFHSMRVAEHGLRHIAIQLDVEITDSQKVCPIEYATWERVLSAIEAKRIEVRKENKGDAHMARTIEYAGLADHCSHLKDLWRNPTMHSRGLYSLPEASGAMGRVAEFMNLVAGSAYAPPVDENMTKGLKALLSMTKELSA